MLYSRKSKMDRRNSIMVAVRKELKAHNAFVAPELLHQLAESLDTARYYNIEVIREVKKAAERLCLEDYQSVHSWAGSEGTVEEGTKVFGRVDFGQDYSYEFSDNGNSSGPNASRMESEFDVNQAFCVLIECHDWRGWENDGCNYDRESTTIVIYSPESIIDEDEYAAEKAAELEQLCQLR